MSHLNQVLFGEVVLQIHQAPIDGRQKQGEAMGRFGLILVLTILGVMELGLSGAPTLLMSKAIMEFLASIFFTASCCWILAVVSVPLGVILAAFYLPSAHIAPYKMDAIIGNFSACDRLIQLVNVLRIAKPKDPPVLDLVPGLNSDIFCNRFCSFPLYLYSIFYTEIADFHAYTSNTSNRHVYQISSADFFLSDTPQTVIHYNFGGILTSKWMWSGHPFTSIIFTPLYSHNFLIMLPTSAFISPYIICLRYFDAKTI